jgi:hypothetical protein
MPGGVPEIPPLASQQLTRSIEVSPAHADPPVKAGVAAIGLGLGGLLGTKLATFPLPRFGPGRPTRTPNSKRRLTVVALGCVRQFLIEA